jgi:hypothetical protein
LRHFIEQVEVLNYTKANINTIPENCPEQ